jgi:ankyrin repeat protein
VNFRDGVFERIKLLIVAKNGLETGVRLLLDHGVDIKTQKIYGQPLLLYAAMKGHGDIVRLLPNHGADIDEQDKHGMTALSWAKTNGHGSVLELLEAAFAVKKMQQNPWSSESTVIRGLYSCLLDINLGHVK